MCPHCTSDQFTCVGSVELGPDSYWDENTVQRAKCGSCRQKFICNYLEKRSFRSDRDDKMSHVAYKARSLPWHLIGFGFETTNRRVSKHWRRKLAEKILAKVSAKGEAMPILYRQ